MQITIENWKGCAKLDVTTANVTLFAGRNGAGKTSALEAIAYTATGQALSVAKRAAKIRRGQSRASCTLKRGDSERNLTLPAGKVTLTDWETTTSPYAAGFIDATTLKPKDLTELMLQYLDARPTADELLKAIAPYGFSKTEADDIVGYIKKHGDDGWDAAHKSYVSQGQGLKGQFKEVTGFITHGGPDGEKWVPENWEAELAAMSLETLQANLADAETQLEAAIRMQAVDDSRHNELKEIFQGIEPAKEAVAKATNDREAARHREKAAQAEYDEARKEFDAVKVPVAGEKPKTIKCHNCGCENLTTGGKPAEYKGPTEAEIKKAQGLKADASAKCSATKSQLEIAQAQVMAASLAVNNAEREVKKCQDAHQELMNGIAKPEGSVTTDEIESLRSVRRQAMQRVEAKKKHDRASTLFKSIVKNAQLLEVLKPEGLRKTKLAAAVKEFNTERLAKVCEIAGWKHHDTNEDLILKLFPEDMTFAFGPTALDECGEAEKAKARITMQISLAYLDRSDMIIIDRIDDLEGNSLEELFTLLSVLDEKTVVVAKHYRDKEQAPDLVAFGMGQTFWIEGNESRLLEGVSV